LGELTPARSDGRRLAGSTGGQRRAHRRGPGNRRSESQGLILGDAGPKAGEGSMRGVGSAAVWFRSRVARSISICLLVFLAATSHAEDKCGSEIKILLEPSELHSVLDAFHAKHGSAGSVSFFDTSKLELLSAGLILRVRSDGADSNLTVKLRLPESLP